MAAREAIALPNESKALRGLTAGDPIFESQELSGALSNQPGDSLYGAAVIAAELRVPVSTERDLIRRGLPGFKLGGIYCGRRSAIAAWRAECARAAVERRG